MNYKKIVEESLKGHSSLSSSSSSAHSESDETKLNIES